MPYAIELALDAATSLIVRRAWDDLEQAGITYMARSGARPHVSLAIWDEVDRAALDAALRAFATEVPPLTLTFERLDVFPGEVVFLRPAANPQLERLHAEFHERFADLGRAPSAHYAPGAWVPHVTLATDFAPPMLPVALEIARRITLPLDATIEAVGIVEFRPVRELCLYPLTGGVSHGRARRDPP